jgi:hypothetical protein
MAKIIAVSDEPICEQFSNWCDWFCFGKKLIFAGACRYRVPPPKKWGIEILDP